jgi:hypothetical protein
MSLEAIVKDFAGRPAIYVSLENSAPPRVHFNHPDGTPNYMTVEEWDALPPWSG